MQVQEEPSVVGQTQSNSLRKRRPERSKASPLEGNCWARHRGVRAAAPPKKPRDARRRQLRKKKRSTEYRFRLPLNCIASKLMDTMHPPTGAMKITKVILDDVNFATAPHVLHLRRCPRGELAPRRGYPVRTLAGCHLMPLRIGIGTLRGCCRLAVIVTHRVTLSNPEVAATRSRGRRVAPTAAAEVLQVLGNTVH